MYDVPIRGRWDPAPWDGNMTDPYFITPNFIILGQTT